MPCYVCNPQCGRCRQPRPRPIRCSSCDSLVMVDHLGDPCPKCGGVLPGFKSIACAYTQRDCVVPCMRATTPHESGEAQACPWGADFGIPVPSERSSHGAPDQ